MAVNDIAITINDSETIAITINDSETIAITLAGGVSQIGISNVVDDISPQLGGNLDSNSNNIEITSGNKLILDGIDGNTYFIYNTVSQKVELYVNNIKKAAWG